MLRNCGVVFIGSDELHRRSGVRGGGGQGEEGVDGRGEGSEGEGRGRGRREGARGEAGDV